MPSSQYLTFSLGDEEFGIEVSHVQEIKGWTAPTPIPNAPTHLRGVINLRGTIIPVLDLRLRLAMPPADYSKFTVIIVVEIGGKVTGVIVDTVSDVLTIAEEEIQVTPDLAARGDTRMVRGLTRRENQIMTLLDIAQVVAPDDVLVQDIAR